MVAAKGADEIILVAEEEKTETMIKSMVDKVRLPSSKGMVNVSRIEGSIRRPTTQATASERYKTLWPAAARSSAGGNRAE